MKFKKILVGVLAATAALSLVGCGDNSDDDQQQVEEQKYTVTFNSNGGSSVTSQTIVSGEKATKPADPTKTGHTFKGWYKDSALTTEFNFNTETITAATTIYAKWEEDVVESTKYTIAFVTNCDESITDVEVEEGSKLSKPNDPYNKHKELVGWFTDAELTQEYDFNTIVTAHMVLYAKWDTVKETVTTVFDFDKAYAAVGASTNATYTLTEDTLFFGKITLASGNRLEHSNGAYNTQGKSTTIVLSGETNSIKIGGRGASSSGATANLKGPDGQIIYTSGALANNVTFEQTLTDLAAGTYVLESAGSLRISTIELTEILEASDVTGIEIISIPQIDFLSGRAFTSNGLTVELQYENGRTDIVTDFIVDSSAFQNAAGVYTINVSFTFDGQTYTDSYEVKVYSIISIALNDHTLSSSRITQNLQKVFLLNGTFNSDYLTVIATAKCGNDTQEFILTSSDYTISTPDLTTVGAKKVEITVGDSIGAEYEINIVEALADTTTDVAVTVDATANVSNTSFTTITDALTFLEISDIASDAIKTLNIAPGTYFEKVEVSIPNVHFIGSSGNRNDVVIEFDALNGLLDPSGLMSYSTDGSASISIRESAVGFTAQSVTFKNYYNTHELYEASKLLTSNTQAVAILVQADQSTFIDCYFTSYHDTLYAQVGRQFYENCYIEGRTDYIFGYNATAFFESCDIYSIGAGVETSNGGYIVATKGLKSSYATDGIEYGYVFNNCTFDGDENVQDNSVSLARGWDTGMSMMVMNSSLSNKISLTAYGTGGNTRYGKMNADPVASQLLEFNNTGEGAITESIANTCTVVDATTAAPYADLKTVFAAQNGNMKYASNWAGNQAYDATIQILDASDNSIVGELEGYIGSTITSNQVNKAISIPAGKSLEGLYTDAACTLVFDFDTELQATNTIYAKFVSAAESIDFIVSGDVTCGINASDGKLIFNSTNYKAGVDVESNEYFNLVAGIKNLSIAQIGLSGLTVSKDGYDFSRMFAPSGNNETADGSGLYTITANRKITITVYYTISDSAVCKQDGGYTKTGDLKLQDITDSNTITNISFTDNDGIEGSAKDSTVVYSATFTVDANTIINLGAKSNRLFLFGIKAELAE